MEGEKNKIKHIFGSHKKLFYEFFFISYVHIVSFKSSYIVNEVSYGYYNTYIQR